MTDHSSSGPDTSTGIPKYESHPAADIFPMMGKDALEDLKTDILAHGQREYAVLFEGKIIDGRNRYRACCELGIECEFSELEECDDPIQYVLSANLHRRHLTTSQRSQVAARARETYDQQAKERQKRKPKSVVENLPQQNRGRARDAAGRALGVSGKMVDLAGKVVRQGIPELIDAVDHSFISTTHAAKIAELPKQQQAAVIKEELDAKRSNKRRKSKPKSRDKHSAWHEFEQYMMNLAGIEDGLLAKYGRSVARMVASPDWDSARNVMAMNYITETIKALQRLQSAFTVVLSADVDHGGDRSRFGVTEIEKGAWLPTYDGEVLLGADNAWNTQQKAQDAAQYHADRCAGQPEFLQRVESQAALYKSARLAEFPVEQRDGRHDCYVIMPDYRDCGPFDEQEARQQSTKFKRQAKEDPSFLQSFGTEARR